MGLNLIMKDQKIPILSIHVVKKKFEFTKTRTYSLTKIKKILKCTNKKVNDVTFPKQDYLFYIEKYLSVFLYSEAKKEDMKIKTSEKCKCCK